MFDDFQPELLYRNFVKYSSPEGRDELAQQCRAKVVEWRWASGDMAFAFRQPFFKERWRQAPKWLKEGAKPKSGNARHGIAADGTIRVVEEFYFDDNKECCFPTYVSYAENLIELVHYQQPDRLVNVRRRVFDGPRLVREHLFHDGGGQEERFEWNQDRVIRIVGLGWKHDRIRWSGERTNSESVVLPGYKATGWTEERFEYDGLGRLDRILVFWLNSDGTVDQDLPPRINYERPKKNESIPQMAKEIERMLVEQIPPAVAKARGKGPFYCLLICYCGEDFGASWPPMLMLKPEAERRRIVERGEEVKYYLWAPDESDETNVYLRYRDEKLDNHCRLHCQLMAVKNDYSSAKKALRNAAKTLNELDWSKRLDVTPDFIVAAVDNTGEFAFATDIKATAPAAKYKALKAAGLI